MLRMITSFLWASCFAVVSGCGVDSQNGSDIRNSTHEHQEMEKAMATMSGQISFTNLPPHCGISVSLAFFEVEGPDSEPPHAGEPPIHAINDCPELYNDDVDLDRELIQPSRDIPFSIEHRTGHFYIQLRTILFRKHNEKVLAQAEQFFFGRRPLTLLHDMPSVTFPIEWPSTPVEELEHYGSVNPENG